MISGYLLIWFLELLVGTRAGDTFLFLDLGGHFLLQSIYKILNTISVYNIPIYVDGQEGCKFWAKRGSANNKLLSLCIPSFSNSLGISKLWSVTIFTTYFMPINVSHSKRETHSHDSFAIAQPRLLRPWACLSVAWQQFLFRMQIALNCKFKTILFLGAINNLNRGHFECVQRF